MYIVDYTAVQDIFLYPSFHKPEILLMLGGGKEIHKKEKKNEGSQTRGSDHTY